MVFAFIGMCIIMKNLSLLVPELEQVICFPQNYFLTIHILQVPLHTLEPILEKEKYLSSST